jgi:two-component system sensor histidine kinase KdpD
MENAPRPNPDELLAHIKNTEQKEKKGKLKIYLGMSAGVGKTFAMLQDASMAYGRKVDVLIGYVETHKRSDTEFLLFHLPQLERKKIQYKGFELEEMDIDEILKRKPKLVIVDELAHTNAPGSRHKKRYLDVLELIDNGIDVFTALNVQHLESLSDTVSQITGVIIKETVPDSILEAADEIELVDISPDELLQRLADGKVYTADKTQNAVNNFFRKGNLSALRELALRLTADRVDKQVRHYMLENKIAGPWKSTQRILIGISASPNSIDLVRWARRIAYTMEASWIAVNVETPKALTEEEKNSLNKNIELAKELGAEVVSTVDVDIVKGLLRIAKRENVTHIVIGKSHHDNFLSRLFGKDIVSRLINESGKIDVYIASGDVVTKEKKNFFKVPDTQSGLSKYFLSAAIVFSVAAICYLFSSFLGYQTIALIFLLVVCLMPLILGPGPVLLAAIVSPMIWNFFFVPPKFTLIISRTEDILTFVMFFIVAYVTGVLTTRIRQRERAVRQREERAVALYNLANDLSTANNINEVASNAINNLTKVLNSEAVFFVSDENSKSIKQIITGEGEKVSEKELSVAQWIYSNGKKAGKFTDSLTSSDYVYYPMKNPRGIYGVVGLKIQNENFYREHETLIDNFISQIAGALERELLNQKANTALVLEESEKLYKTLFDSLSHELKTPIAAIMGSSNLLLNLKAENNSDKRTQLYSEIHTASLRLNRLVENLLDMARLESGKLVPNFNLHDVNDLINSALKQFYTELTNHEIIVSVPENMPLIKIDFGLMEQVIKNLLQNALIYTQEGSKIEIQTSFDENFAYIIISDNGKGITDNEIQNIFDKFYRIDNKVSGGTGLGLSISKGIVEALKGTISAENKSTGGLKFTIKLSFK